METPKKTNSPEAESLLESLEDIAQAAELSGHEITDISKEANDRVAILMEQVDIISKETDEMIVDLQEVEVEVAAELDTLMIEELSDTDETESES